MKPELDHVPLTPLSKRILARMANRSNAVWTPVDFLDLARRAAVDKTLQRLVHAGKLRRIDRGLYDRPRINPLTGRATVPDYRAIIEAVARRDQARFLVDGATAANDLGLTAAVPARIEVWVDARLRPIRWGNQEIRFRTAAPSRLYWAGRPAMRIIQALRWLQDIVQHPEERVRVVRQIRQMLLQQPHGATLREDLRRGLPTLPAWMHDLVRSLLAEEAQT
jgi:hypothetical protein